MKHSIHQTPEERLAQSSVGIASAIKVHTAKTEETTRAVRELALALKDKSLEATGFEAVVRVQKGVIAKVQGLAESSHEGVEQVTKKIEEVKSASVIANRLLKEIRDKKMPNSEHTDALLKELLVEMKKPQQVRIKLV